MKVVRGKVSTRNLGRNGAVQLQQVQHPKAVERAEELQRVEPIYKLTEGTSTLPLTLNQP